MKSALFDTNLVIDALNGMEAAADEYDSYDHVYISLITWMEIMIGTEDGDTVTESFLRQYFEVIPLNLIIADRAVQIRKQKRIKLPDAIIQATAQLYDALLVTRNSHDFSEDEAGVRVPYQI